MSTIPSSTGPRLDIESALQLVTDHAPSPDHVVPLHRGHHPIWDGTRYHVDICNMVDDVVVCESSTGRMYRFPITMQLIPWLCELVDAMDHTDELLGGDASRINRGVRDVVMSAVRLRLLDTELPLNVFEPGVVHSSGSAMTSLSDPDVDLMLRQLLDDNPGARIYARPIT